jgi:hypothetical protein
VLGILNCAVRRGCQVIKAIQIVNGVMDIVLRRAAVLQRIQLKLSDISNCWRCKVAQLANIYFGQGQGVSKDPVEAARYSKLSAGKVMEMANVVLDIVLRKTEMCVPRLFQ